MRLQHAAEMTGTGRLCIQRPIDARDGGSEPLALDDDALAGAGHVGQFGAQPEGGADREARRRRHTAQHARRQRRRGGAHHRPGGGGRRRAILHLVRQQRLDRGDHRLGTAAARDDRHRAARRKAQR